MEKKCLTIVSIFMAILGLAACSGSKSSTIEIKAGHGLNENTAIHKGWLKFKELVETKSNGEIVVNIYPSGQLGDDRELIEALQMGNVTMASPSSAPLASFDSEFYVLDIPFLFTNREQAYGVLDGEAGSALLKSLEKYRIKGLSFTENGFRNLTNSKVAVKSPADLDGLKIRTMENEIHLAAWKMLGASPTPMAFGELFTALQQKTVDGQENPFELIFENKFFEVQQYITKTQHIYTPYIMLMNKDFYEKLSDKNRAIIDESMKLATDYQRDEAKKKAKGAETKIVEAGVEVIELTPEQKAEFQKTVAPVFELVKAKAGKGIVDTFAKATK